MWGPMGQWVQEEHGCHRLHNRMVFISVRDEDNLFCRARQCYLPARLEEAVSRKGESLFTHRKLKFPSCCSHQCWLLLPWLVVLELLSVWQVPHPTVTRVAEQEVLGGWQVTEPPLCPHGTLVSIAAGGSVQAYPGQGQPVEVTDPLTVPTEVPNIRGSPGDKNSGWAKPKSCCREPLASIVCPFVTKGWHRGAAPVSPGEVSLSPVCAGQVAAGERGGGCVPPAVCPGSGVAFLGSRSWWHLLMASPEGPPCMSPICRDTCLPRLGRERVSSSHSCPPGFPESLLLSTGRFSAGKE